MNRRCGECQLCCKLVPVPPLHKPGGVKCKHQKFGVGCAVYRRLAMPIDCQLWNCAWLGGADTRRPDRAHYVIDIMPDFVITEGVKVPVVQIWCDADHPHAYRDPDLLAYLEKEGKPGLVRFNNARGVFLVPASMSDTGRWFEHECDWREGEHSFAEIAQVLSGVA